MDGATPSYPPTLPALSHFPPAPSPTQHLTTSLPPPANGAAYTSSDLQRPQQSLSAVPNRAQDEDTDVDMSESEASAKPEEEEEEDAEFAAYSDASASASPPVVAPGHAAKKRGNKVGLPDYADPDLYGLRRSVSRAFARQGRPTGS